MFSISLFRFKTIVPLLGVMLFCAVAPIGAVEVAVFDLQKVLQTSPKGVAVEQTLQAEFGAQEAVFNSKKAEVDALVEDIQKNRLLLSVEAVREKEVAIEAARNELQAYGGALQQAIALRQRDLMAELQADISAAVEVVAKREQYEVVIYQGVAWHNPAINITDAVMEALADASDSASE